MKPREQIGAELRRVMALRPSGKLAGRRRTCPDCKGTCVTGYSDGLNGTAIDCTRCNGRGFVLVKVTP